MARMTVADLLEQRAGEHPNKTLVACDQERRTYGEAAGVATALAAALVEAGIAAGDRVAFLVPNRMERIDLFFACARLGAVQVPLNTFLKGEFLRYQLADCGAAAAVVDGPGLMAVAPLLPSLPALQRLIVLYDDAGEGPVPNVPATVEVIRFADLDRPAPADADLPRPTPDDLAAIVYTSGTTGPSKGCRSTRATTSTSAAAWQAALELRADDVYFTAFPLFHLSGQALALMATLHRGATLVLEPAFSATTFMARAGAVGATVVMGVGAMAQAILATPPADSDRTHSVRLCSWIPLPEAKQLEFEERFATAVSAEGYGQTECAPVTFSPASGARRRTTAGRPAPWLDVRIVDDDDVAVPAGDVGEIVVRPLEPDSLFQGYWGRAAETVFTFRNLWHHTGDYGRMDAERVRHLRGPQEGRPAPPGGECVLHGTRGGHPAASPDHRGRRPRGGIGRHRGRHQGLLRRGRRRIAGADARRAVRVLRRAPAVLRRSPLRRVRGRAAEERPRPGAQARAPGPGGDAGDVGLREARPHRGAGPAPGRRLTVSDVDIERDGFVATLLMRGSGEHNTGRGTLLQDILEAVEELERDDGVRVVVTASEGPIWCASADFEDLERHLGRPADAQDSAAPMARQMTISRRRQRTGSISHAASGANIGQKTSA